MASGVNYTASGNPYQFEIDTTPFDHAVTMIKAKWDPPVDLKQVIVAELGAILALTSNDTLMVGPRGKKNKAFKSAHAYVLRRYAPWAKWSGRGKRPKGPKDSLQVFQVGGKKYYKRNRYSDAVWAMINAAIKRTRDDAWLSTGSSKAAWLHMFQEAAKAGGVNLKIPKTWKHHDKVKSAMLYMLRKKSCKTATTASAQKRPSDGDFVLKVFSEAHNTLNPGVKGAGLFQKYLNGRQPYLEKTLGKSGKASMKKLAKRYPGIEVGDHS